jgi:hypothetical protein
MFVLLQVIVGYAALPLSTHIQYVLDCHLYFCIHEMIKLN